MIEESEEIRRNLLGEERAEVIFTKKLWKTHLDSRRSQTLRLTCPYSLRRAVMKRNRNKLAQSRLVEINNFLRPGNFFERLSSLGNKLVWQCAIWCWTEQPFLLRNLMKVDVS